MRTTITRVVLLFAVLAAGPGCSSEPCDDAATKLEACLNKLECADVADPTNMRQCTSARAQAEDALDKLRSLPCAIDLKDKAEQVNRCPTVDPANFCNPCLAN